METAPELEIERLVIEDDRPGHIARHDVTVDAVIAVLIGDFVAVPGKEGRYIVIGRDEQERFLAVVLGARAEKGTYGLVTARRARRTERALYGSALEGGEDDD
jgi:uncharacterized DUF497 family protein